MGGRGGPSGMSGGNSQYKNTDEYKWEMERAIEESPVGVAFESENRSDDDVEGAMIRYRSAIGDPIRAMESQRSREQRTLSDYADAVSPGDLATKAALEDVISQYGKAIDRMKRIKQNSRYRDMM